jgi:hypothetical protein
VRRRRGSAQPGAGWDWQPVMLDLPALREGAWPARERISGRSKANQGQKCMPRIICCIAIASGLS